MATTKSLPDTPRAPAKTGATGEGDTADMKVNVQQHGFSGDTCEIKLYKGDKEDAKQQFFAINQYQITIERDRWVRVPVEMADHIESILQTVREQDPAHPDDPDAFVFAEKERFPISRRG